jgi:hypothetical protein
VSSLAFILDADMTPKVIRAVHALEPSIHVQFVGDGISPPRGTLDPELLVYCEENTLALVTFDKRTMPGHIADHLAAGRHTRGVIIIRDQSLAPGRIADELLFVWSCSTAEEWIDRFEYLPFPSAAGVI